MNTSKLFICSALTLSMALFSTSCKNESKTSTENPAATIETTTPTEATDFNAIKKLIQEKETAFAVAQSNGDVEGILSFYSDDAIGMPTDLPMLVGKEAIRADLKEKMAKRTKGNITTFDVLEVFGSENQVTEVGVSTTKDPAGKVTYKGKYMAVWEKRNGDYICIRDIYNDDVKEK